MQQSSPEPSPATSPGKVGPGQVCDRCRQKKVRCDGALPSCAKCKNAGVACVVSAKLRRRTKIRGFHDSADQKLARLAVENEELKRQLKVERDANAILRGQLSATLPATNSHSTLSPATCNIGKLHTGEEPSPFPEVPGNELVIKHMGRLIPDCDGVEQFAGSTTGVHFILSVQEALKGQGLLTAWFPENCFRMHIVAPRQIRISSHQPSQNSHLDVQRRLRLVGSITPSSIGARIRGFVSAWSFLCPAIAATELSQNIVSLCGRISRGAVLDDLSMEEQAMLFQLIMITLLPVPGLDHGQKLDSLGLDDNNRQKDLLSLAGLLLPTITSNMRLCNVQCLVLLSFFQYLTGQHNLNIPLRGILLQQAQALGLHRHHRRFKFSAGEVELRKRLWWCVYILDKFTAIIHGLPQTIKDADVDVDLPSDGELEATSDSGLTLPLPGENTPIRDFITLCRLSQILSSMLSQLYTTTNRRGGRDKIKGLDGHLLLWEVRLRNNDDADDIEHSLKQSADCESSPKMWLSLMKNVARLLIYRPGLTFDTTTPQFRECLDVCTRVSFNIVSLLTQAQARELRVIMPSVYGLVFQCALVHVYYHLPDHSQSPARFSKEESADHVQRSIDFLRDAVFTHASSRDDAFILTITDSVALLQAISPKVLGCCVSPTAAWHDSAYGPVLETMNQLESLSWVFDDQASPFLYTFE
ncbi:fungal-specific transcription factor domain-containing protein [Truncatella angustata]|uniref:Fungal-specific transcription factor domain-containing protein n=1 Tax=Truncatella angustata TaxID=152316 RepID=A0A9P8UL62_9PEZI|nr:fungal-specific transcription factor domain-containing protein [Truncatella angustata]KAH6654224.1 fungal-specific transcription factor domain-containing protein [Truncatella angustata]